MNTDTPIGAWFTREATPSALVKSASSLYCREPYRLVNWGRRWYLVAWDLDREAWRSFRVDRMALRPPTRRSFPPRHLPEEDVSGFVLRGVASAGWTVRARVRIHAPTEIVIVKIDPSVGLVEAIDDAHCSLLPGADHPMTIAVHLALVDEDFTVDGPPELNAAIERLAVRYAAAAPQGAIVRVRGAAHEVCDESGQR